MTGVSGKTTLVEEEYPWCVVKQVDSVSDQYRGSIAAAGATKSRTTTHPSRSTRKFPG